MSSLGRLSAEAEEWGEGEQIEYRLCGVLGQALVQISVEVHYF